MQYERLADRNIAVYTKRKWKIKKSIATIALFMLT